MVSCVMSSEGTRCLYTVESIIELHEYKKVLQQGLIQEIKDSFQNGDFISDEAPFHKASSVTKYLSERKNIKNSSMA